MDKTNREELRHVAISNIAYALYDKNRAAEINKHNFTKEYEKAEDIIQNLINQQVLSVLKELKLKTKSYEMWANDGEYIYEHEEAVPLSTIQELERKFRNE